MTQVKEDAVERREYFRIDDFITLKLERLTDAQLPLLLADFVEQRNAFAMANNFVKTDDKYLFEFNELKQRYPDVAAYIARLEQRIVKLAHLIEQSNNEFPNQPTHRVNISGKGLRFSHWEALNTNEYVLLKMLLYPSLTRIFAVGKVIDSVVDRKLSASGGVNKSDIDERYYAVRVNFEHIMSEDQELLVRHIHALQRRRLRVKRS